jgi:hypothetical protein
MPQFTGGDGTCFAAYGLAALLGVFEKPNSDETDIRASLDLQANGGEDF